MNGLKYQTAKWDQLLSYWDEVVESADPSSEGLLNLDGRTITQIFEPYFRQMGLPVLMITMEGTRMKIKSDRFLFNQVEDKAFPKSSYEYKWDIPLVVESNGGQRMIVWIDDAGLTDKEWDLGADGIRFINPDANIWCRINFDSSYIAKIAADTAGFEEDKLRARNVAKIMHDHTQLHTSDYEKDYQGGIKDLFELTKLFIGQRDHTKWIMWRELEFNNIFDELDDVFIPFLISVAKDDVLAV